jgi:hypothetical protein
MYSRNVASSQVIPEFLLASEYEYQATLPALRLMTPLRTGPTAFFAFSPIWWLRLAHAKDLLAGGGVLRSRFTCADSARTATKVTAHISFSSLGSA